MLDITEKHVFFYKEWPSNFYRADFKYTSMFNGEEHQFFCTEQAFMSEKAACFGNTAVAKLILACEAPWTAKELGRSVTPYDDAEWASGFPRELPG